jgi:hypothetical protein
MKRCRHCKKPFEPKFSTLEACCSPPCAIAYAKAASPTRLAADVRKARAAEKREHRAAKVKAMTVNALYAVAQRAVNAFVRFRDRFKGCISCPSSRVDDAGHMFPIGSKWRCHPIRLDPRLINGQCRKCNSYVGGGNLHGYLEGLERRYGKAFVDECYAIKAAAERGEIPLLTRDEIIAKGAEFNRATREARAA